MLELWSTVFWVNKRLVLGSEKQVLFLLIGRKMDHVIPAVSWVDDAFCKVLE